MRRHGVSAVEDIVTELRNAGLNIVASGEVGTKNLQFVLATAAMDQAPIRERFAALGAETPSGLAQHAVRSHLLALGLALGVVALIGAHAGALWSIVRLGLGDTSNPISYAVVALVTLFVMLKIGVLGGLLHWSRSRRQH